MTHPPNTGVTVARTKMLRFLQSAGRAHAAVRHTAYADVRALASRTRCCEMHSAPARPRPQLHATCLVSGLRVPSREEVWDCTRSPIKETDRTLALGGCGGGWKRYLTHPMGCPEVCVCVRARACA